MKVKCVIYLTLLYCVYCTTAETTTPSSSANKIHYRCTTQGYYYSEAKFSNVIIDESTIPLFTCDSTSQKQTVKFEMSSIQEVPKKLFDTFSNLLVANFTRSGIKYINRYSLDRAVNLQKLDLSSNAIEQLNANCFSGATALLELNLSFNNISSIDKLAFNTLLNLILLRLTGNKLRSLDNKVFEPLKSLRTIYLNSNELQVIESGIIAKNTKLQFLLLQNNHINMVEEGAFLVENLEASSSNLTIVSLSNNKLTKLNLGTIKVNQLYLTNNTLEALHLSPWIGTVYAENNIISNVTVSDVTNMQLKTLRLANNSITSLESIQQFHSLVDLDLSNNHIGPLNITSLAKLANLQQLGLERTFISNLQHGTFAQQQSLKWLDISYNNLDRFDFDILTSSAALQQIFLDGNRLKSLNYEHLKKTFPALVKIGLSENNWNCTYLIQLVRYCNEHSIELFKSQAVQNQTNVKGIYCFDDKNPLANWNNTLQHVQALHPHLNSTTEDSALQTLLQSVLDDVKRFSENHADVANQTSKLDGAVYDLTKNQFNIQKDVNSLRQSLFEIRLALMANRTNGSVGADNDELRRMIETANNLTLDKQELSAKTLEFKIYEQTFKVDKALELAHESIDKNTVLAKRVEQWISNIVSTSGMLGQDRLLVHQSAAQVEGSGGNGNGVNIAVLVMLCVLIGLIMIGIFKLNRGSYGVERRRYANRDSSMATIINNDI
uniref:Uncharacterized protein n=1 Tax=Anopheles arabiensis TaxID=7173 RepID=A0A182II42_ANOAR